MSESKFQSVCLLPALNKKKWSFIPKLHIDPAPHKSSQKPRSIVLRNDQPSSGFDNSYFDLSKYDSIEPINNIKQTLIPVTKENEDESNNYNEDQKPLNKTIDAAESSTSLYTKLRKKITFTNRLKVLQDMKSNAGNKRINIKKLTSQNKFTEITPEIRKRIEENTGSIIDQGTKNFPSFWNFRIENSESFMNPLSRLFFIP